MQLFSRVWTYSLRIRAWSGQPRVPSKPSSLPRTVLYFKDLNRFISELNEQHYFVGWNFQCSWWYLQVKTFKDCFFRQSSADMRVNQPPNFWNWFRKTPITDNRKAKNTFLTEKLRKIRSLRYILIIKNNISNFLAAFILWKWYTYVYFIENLNSSSLLIGL